MIRIEHLTKSFGRNIVFSDVSVSVELGESVALWGGNGTGKTTLIRCIAGLHAYSGSIHVDTLDAKRCGKQVRQLIGFVPQESGIYDDLRVGRAVEFFASLRGMHRFDVNEVLSPVGLVAHSRKRVRELSGGMKQRLALAIALLGDPPVLLLDEVTASLDAIGRSELIHLLSKVARSDRRAMLFASHRVEEIAAMATRVLVLGNGRIERDLTCAHFVSEFAEMSLLHLLMDHPSAHRAMTLLSASGFDARMNGRGILVRVRTGERMKPLDLLRQERLAIDDFELLPERAERETP